MDNLEFERRMEEFRSRLKKHGLKVTAQRIAVHEAMLKFGHASADMVAEEILKNGKAKVTVASVYKVLTQLSMADIYRHRMSSNNKMIFDVDTSGHIHLYDTVNHVHIDVMDDAAYKEIEGKLLSRRFKGYKVEGIDVQILVRPTSRRKR